MSSDLDKIIKLDQQDIFEWGTHISAARPVGGGAPQKATGKLLRILRRQPDGSCEVARAIWSVDPQEDTEG